MNKAEFSDGMTILSRAYIEDKLINENTLNVWYQFFKDINNTVFHTAVEEIIIESVKRPSISELHEKCIKVKKTLTDNTKNEDDTENDAENDDEEWDKLYDDNTTFDWGNF